jgi:Ca2+-binding RTX toxin-like protein
VSANGKSKVTQVTTDNGTRTFVDGDDNVVKFADGTSDVVVSGEGNTVVLNNGSLIVGSGASVIVKGSNDIIIAAQDATVTAANGARTFRVQANLSYAASLSLPDAQMVGTEKTYISTYIAEDGKKVNYYIGENINGRLRGINSLDIDKQNRHTFVQTSHIFLNGSEDSYHIDGVLYPVNYKKINVSDIASSIVYDTLTSITLDADGYIGASDGYGNWVTAVGSVAVYMSGSNLTYASDYMTGGDGNDIIDGGLGHKDILIGGAGDDTIYFDKESYTGYIQWGCSDYYAPLGSSIHSNGVAIDGGDGYDTAVLNSTSDAFIDLAHGHFEALISNAGDDVITGNLDAEGYIDGGAGDDDITGGKKDDVLIGGVGNDLLKGGVGDDLLEGSVGNDVLSGGTGADTVDGGSGVDTVAYTSSGAAVKVTLGTRGAQTTASGGSGSDALGDVIRNVENVTGGAFSDVLTGNSSTNVLDGRKGSDTLNGGGGNDALKGGGGFDTYIFGAAQQSEIIVNGLSSNTGASGELDIAFDSDQLWFVHSGDDLVIDVLGTARQVVVKDWYDSASSQDWERLSVISANDGLELTSAQQVDSLVQAMATFAANYKTSKGIAFDPTAVGASDLAATTIAQATKSANTWHS